MKNKLAVLGSGSWGSALAWLFADNFDEVYLWSRESSQKQLRKNIIFTSKLEEAVQDAGIITLVVTSAGTRKIAKDLKALGIGKSQVILNASKGLELPSFFRMSEVISQELPSNKVATLSGPTLAKEIMDGLPAAATVSSEDIETAEFLQKKLHVPERFRLYTNPDIVGVELGGTFKNVLAIASGFIEATKLGDNAKSAILTRGFAEIVKVSTALGANPSTLYGLSGLGDVLTTCLSPLSRNFRVGYGIGKGKELSKVIEEIGEAVEGVETSKAMHNLSMKMGAETPTCNAIYEALYTKASPSETIKKLVKLELKSEEAYALK